MAANRFQSSGGFPFQSPPKISPHGMSALKSGRLAFDQDAEILYLCDFTIQLQRKPASRR